MGNSSSVPERIFKAARNNDVAELQGLCRDMQLNGSLDAATKRSWLNYADSEGRTGLHWACQKNYLQVAQILLEQGADVHAIAPKRISGGSPLAEAVAARNIEIVNLLLCWGADPFTENPAGKAPFDLALEMKAVGIVRALERHALFAGWVNTKVLQLKGFSHTCKDRWVVIAPRFTPPPPPARPGSVGVVRVMLLAFRNPCEAEPRTKIWLDGAVVYRTGHDAVLRLHPNHQQPRNIFTKYDNGWMIFFKQAAGTPGDGGSALQPAAGHAASFAAFMATAHRPLDTLMAQQQQRAAAAAAAGPGSAPPQQPQQPVDAFGGSPLPPAPAANPWGSQPASPQAYGARPLPPPAAGAGFAGGPHGGSAPLHYMHAGLQLRPAGAPPEAAQGPASPWQQPGGAGAGELALFALPGESDEEFARRLASTLGSGSGSPGRSRPPPATGPPSAAPSAVGSRVGSLSQAAQLPPPSDNPFRAENPSRDERWGSSGQPAGADAAAAAATGPAPQATAFADVAAPSAPPAAGSTGSGGSDAAGDGECCVICLSNAREVGLLHGETVHKCLCRECAPMVRVGTACPICRATVERVLGVY